MSPARQPKPGDARFILLTGLCIGAFLSLIPVRFRDPKALLMPLFGLIPDPHYITGSDPMARKWAGFIGLIFIVLAAWALFRNSTRAACIFVALWLASIVIWYVRVIALVSSIH